MIDKRKEDKLRKQSNQLIGKFLLNYREKRNLTQKQMGKMFGVSYQQYQKYETGKNEISLWRILCLPTFAQEFEKHLHEMIETKG